MKGGEGGRRKEGRDGRGKLMRLRFFDSRVVRFAKKIRFESEMPTQTTRTGQCESSRVESSRVKCAELNHHHTVERQNSFLVFNACVCIRVGVWACRSDGGMI